MWPQIHEGIAVPVRTPRIAICDLLMCWPPDAGAFVDVVNVATWLSRHATVKLIVPRIETFFSGRKTVVDTILGKYSRFFLRGAIDGPMPFDVQHIEISGLDFKPSVIGRRYSAALESFCPDATFISNGWHLKAHLAKDLAPWRPILRIYAHEFLCTKADGWFFRRGKLCERNYLNGRSDYLSCLACSASFYARHPAVRWVQEYVQARAWAPGYREVVKEGLRAASTVIVYNQWTESRIRPYNDCVMVIPSGVDCAKFAPSLEQPPGPVAVVVPGRVGERHKGRDFLAKVISRMASVRPQMIFRITGSLKGISGANVQAAGWLSPERLPDLYRAAHVAFIPSLWPEPQGIVALEAAASGLPVVATSVGGLKELISDGRTGYLVPPGDVSRTVEVLSALCDDPLLRRRLGRKGRQLCLERYQWETILENQYRELFLGSRTG